MEQGLVLAREVNDPWLIARAVTLLMHVEGSQNPAAIEGLADEAIAIAQSIGDQYLVSRCLYFQGVSAQFHGHYRRARLLLEEMLRVAREVSARWEMTWALTQLGWLEVTDGNFPAARPLFEESLQLQRQVGNRLVGPATLAGLGIAELFSGGDYAGGKALVREGLSLGRSLGTDMWVGWCLHVLGEFARFEGDLEDSVEFHRQALERHSRIKDLWGIPVALEALAAVAVDQQRYQRAAWLYGAAESVRNRYSYPRFPSLRTRYELSLKEVRTAMDRDSFQRKWEEGRKATVEQILEAAGSVRSSSQLRNRGSRDVGHESH
jgi:tetratricopeptide (TPR) repeat protein